MPCQWIGMHNVLYFIWMSKFTFVIIMQRRSNNNGMNVWIFWRLLQRFLNGQSTPLSSMKYDDFDGNFVRHSRKIGEQNKKLAWKRKHTKIYSPLCDTLCLVKPLKCKVTGALICSPNIKCSRLWKMMTYWLKFCFCLFFRSDRNATSQNT